MGKSLADWKIGDPMINENDYWQDPNYVAEDPEKEKLVLQLATLITDRYVKKPAAPYRYPHSIKLCVSVCLTGLPKRD